ncbi:MAG: cytochrome c5 family protein [Azonexus sp.]|nr:cytochrome c5 family protein [Betaproteobacteria bacterium]MBP6034952.1 cytochrome c5 family protein [Azonexus sp.]MBP6905658.1 cytochrome c5 family protein [Azonexus sp.]
MAESHSSKSIMVASIVVAVVGIALIVPLSLKGDRSAAQSGSSDAADVRIQPVAKFELQKAAAATGGAPKDGPTVYNSVCGACHNSGVANAPKAGDKGAWGPRIGQGKDALYKSALGGKGAMPPKGGAADLSDAEIKAAVDHLVGLAK